MKLDPRVQAALLNAKLHADIAAVESAKECRAMLMRSPTTMMMAGNVGANHKFFRRLAGLRGGDLNKQLAPKSDDE